MVKKTSKKIPAKDRFYDRRKILLEIIPILFVIAMFAIAFYVKPMLPDNIPTHWNASGVADNYGSSGNIFLIPALYLLITILLIVLPSMEVFKDNMRKIYDYYYMFKILFSIFFMGLFVSTILPNFGYDINTSQIVISMISILFIGLGFILPKLKRNFMFGIRTGWTLSSDIVWERTHKLGGIMFIVSGIITLIMMIFVKLEILFFIFIGLIILSSLISVMYSYIVYRNEIKNNEYKFKLRGVK